MHTGLASQIENIVVKLSEVKGADENTWTTWGKEAGHLTVNGMTNQAVGYGFIEKDNSRSLEAFESSRYI